MTPFLRDPVAIQQWLSKHCTIEGTVVIEDSQVTVTGSVTLENYTGAQLLVEFNTVSGLFAINTAEITSLVGAPVAAGAFRCMGCAELKNLEASPQTVVSYEIYECNQLLDLKGAPSFVTDFCCCSCYALSTLQGAPATVTGIFNCSRCINLVDLRGAPTQCKAFDCRDCTGLTSLLGAPTTVTTYFNASNTFIRTLHGSPREVGYLHCNQCPELYSLEGAPIHFQPPPPSPISFLSVCDCPALKNLNGLQHSDVNTILAKGGTQLTSWVGLPKTVTTVKLGVVTSDVWPLPPQLQRAEAQKWHQPSAAAFKQLVIAQTDLTSYGSNKTAWFGLYQDFRKEGDYLSLMERFTRLYRVPFDVAMPTTEDVQFTL